MPIRKNRKQNLVRFNSEEKGEKRNVSGLMVNSVRYHKFFF